MGVPLDKRTEDHNKLLIKSYIRGLVSHDIARTVLQASATSLQEAMSIAIDGDEVEGDKVEDALHRLGHREEEPMDVSSIVQKQTSSLKSLSRQLDKINSKLAKVEIQMQQGGTRRPNRRQGNKPSWTADGKPICFSCNSPGHISRHCPHKGQKNRNMPMDVSTVPLTTGQNQENF